MPSSPDSSSEGDSDEESLSENAAASKQILNGLRKYLWAKKSGDTMVVGLTLREDAAEGSTSREKAGEKVAGKGKSGSGSGFRIPGWVSCDRCTKDEVECLSKTQTLKSVRRGKGGVVRKQPTCFRCNSKKQVCHYPGDKVVSPKVLLR